MDKMRAALIGTGNIAAYHMEGLEAEHERVELIAAVEVNADSLAAFSERYRINRCYHDAAKMLAAQHPDLVLICTPPHLHCDLSIQALEAGAWVLCEKPHVASLAELDRIEAAEARSGRYCGSVFQWRFGSAAQHVRRLIDDGVLGRPLLGICSTLWYRDQAYYAAPWRGKWETELGGVTMGHGIHAMDLLLWLMGDWREVSAQMATLDHQIEVEDVSLAHVRFENGALASIVNSVVSPRQVSYVRLDFQRATVELEHLYEHANRHWRFSMPPDAAWSDELAVWQTIAEDKPARQAAQLSHMLDCMERGERPITSGTGARNTVEFVASLYKSGMTGQPVRRGSITPGDPFYERMCGPCTWPVSRN